MSEMPDATAWRNARKLLCVRLDALGDVLMTTPALRAVRQSGRERQITLLTSSAGAEAGRLIGDVDEVLLYDAPWVKASHARIDSRPDHSMVQTLRLRGFDAAIIFTVYSQNPLPAALMCFLADIPLRLAHCHENAYQLLTNWVPDPEPHDRQRHEVRRQLDLVGSVGCTTDDERLGVRVPAAARDHVQRVLRELGLDGERGRPWVAIHPGASAPSRRYPDEHFAEVARQLVQETGCRVVFTGSVRERDLISAIRRAMGVDSLSVAGEFDVAQLAAFLQRAPLLIANNTGPVHLAAAMGTPIVDLYALTNPQHTPWGVANRVLYHDVPCRFCYKSVCPEQHHACLRLVSPRSVVTAACELLQLDRASALRRSSGAAAPAQPYQRATESAGGHSGGVPPRLPVHAYPEPDRLVRHPAFRWAASLQVQHWPECGSGVSLEHADALPGPDARLTGDEPSEPSA